VRSWKSFINAFSSGVAGRVLAVLLALRYFQRLQISGTDALIYLIPHMFLAYSLMYYVIPKVVVRGKYIQAAVLMLVLFFATGAISACVSNYVLDDARRRAAAAELAHLAQDMEVD